jgi:hypothetical protein
MKDWREENCVIWKTKIEEGKRDSLMTGVDEELSALLVVVVEET